MPPPPAIVRYHHLHHLTQFKQLLDITTNETLRKHHSDNERLYKGVKDEGDVLQ